MEIFDPFPFIFSLTWYEWKCCYTLSSCYMSSTDTSRKWMTAISSSPIIKNDLLNYVRNLRTWVEDNVINIVNKITSDFEKFEYLNLNSTQLKLNSQQCHSSEVRMSEYDFSVSPYKSWSLTYFVHLFIFSIFWFYFMIFIQCR